MCDVQGPLPTCILTETTSCLINNAPIMIISFHYQRGNASNPICRKGNNAPISRLAPGTASNILHLERNDLLTRTTHLKTEHSNAILSTKFTTRGEGRGGGRRWRSIQKTPKNPPTIPHTHPSLVENQTRPERGDIKWHSGGT